MLHALYIVAFAVLAVLAISNLVRNLITLGASSRQPRGNGSLSPFSSVPNGPRPVPHPELLDKDGNVISEPLLIMRSISVKDAREQLDALYEASGSSDSYSSDNGDEPPLVH